MQFVQGKAKTNTQKRDMEEEEMTTQEAINQLNKMAVTDRDYEAVTVAKEAMTCGEWISMKDRLRDSFKTVLVYKPNEKPSAATEGGVNSMSKCTFGEGITIKLDGVHELDPCCYETVEEHKGCTVRVLRCKKCGHTEIEWEKDEE